MPEPAATMHFGHIVEYYRARGDKVMARLYIHACWWGQSADLEKIQSR